MDTTESETEARRDRKRLRKLGHLAERARAEIALSVDNLPHNWRVAVLHDALSTAVRDLKQAERRHG